MAVSRRRERHLCCVARGVGVECFKVENCSARAHLKLAAESPTYIFAVADLRIDVAVANPIGEEQCAGLGLVFACFSDPRMGAAPPVANYEIQRRQNAVAASKSPRRSYGILVEAGELSIPHTEETVRKGVGILRISRIGLAIALPVSTRAYRPSGSLGFVDG